MHRARHSSGKAGRVRQVFCEVEYIGKYIAETKAACQWVLAIEGCKKEKVSFAVHDSSVSGKKEIFQDGVHVYSHVVTSHPRETFYRDTLYLLTLDYYTYFCQHVIHIQVLQKKGIMSSILPRVFRLFVDGVNFDLLPVYFRQDALFSCSSMASSCNPPSLCDSLSSSSSTESWRNRSSASSEYYSRSRSREMARFEPPIKRMPLHPRSSSCEHQYNRPVWLAGRGY